MRRIASIILLATAAQLVCAMPGEAQFFRRRRMRVPPKTGMPDISGGLTFCRLVYTSTRRDGSGNGWSTDYPEAERNFLIRISQLTTTKPSHWADGEPGYTTVNPLDPDLYKCPFIMATDVGELGFNDAEREVLRDYLAKGGFFWADDFWGSAGWSHFTAEVARLLPDRALVEIEPDHPLFSQLYIIPKVPQIPSINSWSASGGATSELGADSATPEMWGVFDDDGRILILVTHNTDISDGWEREAYSSEYFYLFSPEAYAVAVNVMLWVMAH